RTAQMSDARGWLNKWNGRDGETRKRGELMVKMLKNCRATRGPHEELPENEKAGSRRLSRFAIPTGYSS
ncbi:MAG TPA: hypothetical protein VFG32_10125, partial [Bacteroidota bacterium]|nr:hypothetical protein [Bacteroidota bacterium]